MVRIQHSKLTLHRSENGLRLSTQPPGPVILLGHSMGGLLAAEAATDISNNPERHPGAKPRRIIGMIAFDTPYLGMHPHVVVSGIASLFPKDEDEDGKQKKTLSEMNNHSQVKMVDEKVTDDWDAFKKNLNGNLDFFKLFPARADSDHSPVIEHIPLLTFSLTNASSATHSSPFPVPQLRPSPLASNRPHPLLPRVPFRRPAGPLGSKTR